MIMKTLIAGLGFAAGLANTAAAQTPNPVPSILAVHEAKIKKIEDDVDAKLKKVEVAVGDNNRNIVTDSIVLANKWRLASTGGEGDTWLRLYDAKGVTYSGGIATDASWSRRFLINGKWLLSDTLNDEWLRLYDSSGSNYYGGFAAQKLWTTDLVFSNNVRITPLMSDYIMIQNAVGQTVDVLARTFYGNTWGHHTEFSDRRLKKDIEPLPKTLSKILSLRPVSYHLIKSDNDRKEIGFIAQELQEQFPEVIDTDKDYLGVQYQKLTAPLVKAVQEQQELIDEQHAMIKSLKERLEKLEGQFAKVR